MKTSVVIVAGGKGSRMGSDLPKQFMLLLDVPVLMHTIERFAHTLEDAHIVVVLPEDHIALWENLCRQMDFDIVHEVVEGGTERFTSVKNGLAHCPDEGVIGIHDGVRPLVSEALVARCCVGQPEAPATPSWFDRLTMRATESSEDLMVSLSNHEVRASIIR